MKMRVYNEGKLCEALKKYIFGDLSEIERE